MDAFAVRDAEPRDASRIADVRARSWGADYSHVFPHETLEAMLDRPRLERATTWWRGAIERSVRNVHTLVVDGEGGVVGFASIGHVLAEQSEPEDVGELYAIYVLPDVRGHGIGRALMAEALGRLRSGGFGTAILWVLEDNPRTRRFYDLTGWSHDGGVKEDEWLGTRVREVRYRISLDP